MGVAGHWGAAGDGGKVLDQVGRLVAIVAGAEGVAAGKQEQAAAGLPNETFNFAGGVGKEGRAADGTAYATADGTRGYVVEDDDLPGVGGELRGGGSEPIGRDERHGQRRGRFVAANDENAQRGGRARPDGGGGVVLRPRVARQVNGRGVALGRGVLRRMVAQGDPASKVEWGFSARGKFDGRAGDELVVAADLQLSDERARGREGLHGTHLDEQFDGGGIVGGGAEDQVAKGGIGGGRGDEGDGGGVIGGANNPRCQTIGDQPARGGAAGGDFTRRAPGESGGEVGGGVIGGVLPGKARGPGIGGGDVGDEYPHVAPVEGRNGQVLRRAEAELCKLADESGVAPGGGGGGRHDGGGGEIQEEHGAWHAGDAELRQSEGDAHGGECGQEDAGGAPAPRMPPRDPSGRGGVEGQGQGDQKPDGMGGSDHRGAFYPSGEGEGIRVQKNPELLFRGKGVDRRGFERVAGFQHDRGEVVVVDRVGEVLGFQRDARTLAGVELKAGLVGFDLHFAA